MAKINGTNGWPVRLVIGGLFVIATGTTGLGAKWLVTQQGRCQTIQRLHGERLSRLEAVERNTNDSLGRIETLLIQVLARKGGRDADGR